MANWGGFVTGKMKIVHGSPAQYSLILENNEISINHLLGKNIRLEHNNLARCIGCGASKVHDDGFCFLCVRKRPETDICQVRPELCHYEAKTCRDEEFAKTRCFIPHVVYLSLSSHLKVGITREMNVPSRFLDQGAVKALPIARVQDRISSGSLEVKLKEKYSDKTSWQKMLKAEVEPQDLLLKREEALGYLADANLNFTPLLGPVLSFEYPSIKTPDKIKSISPVKLGKVEGELWGMRGQYLILSTGVVQMRNLVGYHLEVTADC